MPPKEKGAKVDPFKTRKTRTETKESSDTVHPPENVSQAIDAFRECQEQAKHFEGEATIHKDQILAYSLEEFAKRATQGQDGSYKLLGEEAMVTFVATEASAGLTDEDVAQIEERWGEKAARELVVRDFGSIRFEPTVLAAHYEEVVGALQQLPTEILEKLFRPMLMKAAPGVLEKARQVARNPKELRELFQALKIRFYIK